MRKRSRRRVRPCSAPMLVNRGIHNTELSMVEEMYVEAFAGGWATKEHFDGLVDMLNVLTLAGSYKETKDSSLAAICEAVRIPLWNIRQRHEKTDRMGVTGEELKLMRVFVDFYADFWLRQPVALYEAACNELTEFKQGESA